MHKPCDVIVQWKIPWNCEKKTRYMHAINEESDLIFQWISPKNYQTKSSVPTYRPQSMRCHFSMKIFHEIAKKKPIPTCHEWSVHVILFFNESVHKIIKQKPLYLHTVHKACDVIFQWKFSMKLRKKNSIPTCHEWRVWSHFSMNLSIKLSNKKLGTYIPLTTHAMSFFNGNFPWNCEKKARYLHAMNEEYDLIFQCIFP